MFRRPVRDQLRRELIKRGIPICRRCAYNLTGLSEPRCPECGTSFDPHESAI
jgi:predicted amidophosphoribosyltransferase